MQIKVSNQKELDDLLNQKQKEKEEDEKKREQDIQELRSKISSLAKTVVLSTKADKNSSNNKQMYQILENVCQYLKNGSDFVYGQKGGQKDYGLQVFTVFCQLLKQQKYVTSYELQKYNFHQNLLNYLLCEKTENMVHRIFNFMNVFYKEDRHIVQLIDSL